MKKFKYIQKEKINKLPKAPGVYIFYGKKEILYIGKAINLCERIKQHRALLNQVKQLAYIETESEIDALILEAKLIKKYQPKYNVAWKDDKNYFYVGITKEDFPRIFWTHQPKLKPKTYNLKPSFVGPFVDGKALKQTLKFLRKTFPYYSQRSHPKKLCPWCHLNLCPGPSPDKKEYKKNIKNLKAVLSGKRKSVLKKLKQEMKTASAEQNFEKAARLYNQISALEKIISHAKVIKQKTAAKKSPCRYLQTEQIIKKILRTKAKIRRIEAYDVSNIQGKQATGSMVTFINGRPDKNFYRKFRIKIQNKPNDTAMIKEILSRRLKHQEWPYPDLILVDGGKAQLKAVESAINNYQLAIPAVSLAKRKNELFIQERKKPIPLKTLPRAIFNLILQLRDEAHRFALNYHHKLRAKSFIQ